MDFGDTVDRDFEFRAQAVEAAGIVRIESRGRHRFDVWSCLKVALACLAAGESDLELLLPYVWKQSHPDNVRHFREEDQRQVAERKRYRRAQRRLARLGG